LFYLTDEYQDRWRGITGSMPTAMYGFQSEVPPEPVPVTLESMIMKFKEGVQEYREYWSTLLPESTVTEVNRVAQLAPAQFLFPPEVWTRVVYDFAAAYHHHLLEVPSENPTELGNSLVTSLVPLYFGRTASFVKETSQMPTYEAEGIIEKLCGEFETQKAYFTQKWFGQDKTDQGTA
jgi:hypothetical protein